MPHNNLNSQTTTNLSASESIKSRFDLLENGIQHTTTRCGNVISCYSKQLFLINFLPE